MDRGTSTDAGISNLLRIHTTNLAAPSLSAFFKVDEGYSDETRSQSDRESKPSAEDVITLPNWVLTHSETDRAGECTSSPPGNGTQLPPSSSTRKHLSKRWDQIGLFFFF